MDDPVKNPINAAADAYFETKSAEKFDAMLEETRKYLDRSLRIRFHDEQERGNVVTDTIIQIIKNIHTLQEPKAYIGWVTTIARNGGLQYMIRAKKPAFVDHEILEATICNKSEGPAEIVLNNEEANQVRAALNRIDNLHRDTATAFYCNDESVATIADKENAPIGTIKRRLYTARARIREELKPYMDAEPNSGRG